MSLDDDGSRDSRTALKRRSFLRSTAATGVGISAIGPIFTGPVVATSNYPETEVIHQDSYSDSCPSGTSGELESGFTIFAAEGGCAAGNWRMPVEVDCAAAREQDNDNGCLQCREITESKIEHTWDTSEGDLYRDSNDNELDGYIGASHEQHTDEDAWSYEDYADIAVEYTVDKLASRIPFSTELRTGGQVVETMQKDLFEHTDTTTR